MKGLVAVLASVSLLAGFATCDGIIQAFPKTRNIAMIIGQVATAGSVGGLVSVLVFITIVLVAGIICGFIETFTDKKGEVHD